MAKYVHHSTRRANTGRFCILVFSIRQDTYNGVSIDIQDEAARFPNQSSHLTFRAPQPHLLPPHPPTPDLRHCSLIPLMDPATIVPKVATSTLPRLLQIHTPSLPAPHATTASRRRDTSAALQERKARICCRVFAMSKRTGMLLLEGGKVVFWVRAERLGRGGGTSLRVGGA